MIRNFYFDRVLFIAFFVLMILGLIFVYSATSIPSLINHKDPFLYLKREVIWLFIGFVAMIGAYLTPVETLKKIAYPLALLTIALLVIVLIMPASINGLSVKRWIDLGFARFQPSELAKLSVILFLAYFISRKENDEKFLKSWTAIFVALSFPTVVIALILIEPHKGAAIFIAVLTFLVMFSSRLSTLKVMVFPVLATPIFIYVIMFSHYAHKRIEAMLDPIANRSGVSYQVFQSILAFVKGGLTGEGIGGGTQKLKYLPEIHTDYIFALIGEEAGFIGAVLIIGIFLVILYRGIKISLDLDDTFSQILGVGLTYLIVLQALMHMAVNSSIFPPTGFTLPFISYGGSSLLIMAISAGILLRLSKEPKKSIYKRSVIS
ncbi:putative lipid II flippase FtsW [Persephonella sp. KM09-Lau-8]|uniref:putative lipid II flippase FtsW n=1 Tax=Persephonella sp. KM09-Lau-8 TaxID=1158345 RepID=UPI0004951A95|nr:putative lipid II flippase FtsW [Persephonella sp. KM09-Lau-8]